MSHAEGGRFGRRLKRVHTLLEHLPERAVEVKRRCVDRMASRTRGVIERMDTTLSRFTASIHPDPNTSPTLPPNFNPLPGLPALLSSVEDDVVSNELTAKVSNSTSLYRLCLSKYDIKVHSCAF